MIRELKAKYHSRPSIYYTLEPRIDEHVALETTQLTNRDLIFPARAGQPVQLCRVGNRMIGVPATPQYLMLPTANAVVVDGAKAQLLPGEVEDDKRLLIAGCDPGISLLSQHLDIIAAPSTSHQALEWLKQGKVHVAGTHLRDSLTGDYNLPVIKQLSHLPVMADPSHGTGRRDKVAAMARAAVAAGADGLLIEVHENPERALSDGAQSLYPDQFDELMDEVRMIAPAVGRKIAGKELHQYAIKN